MRLAVLGLNAAGRESGRFWRPRVPEIARAGVHGVSCSGRQRKQWGADFAGQGSLQLQSSRTRHRCRSRWTRQGKCKAVLLPPYGNGWKGGDDQQEVPKWQTSEDGLGVVVPWGGWKIVQVMAVWYMAFQLIARKLMPFLEMVVHIDQSLPIGQAVYFFMLDVFQALAALSTLHFCLAKFRPHPKEWLPFRFRGIYVIPVLCCIAIFPFIEQLAHWNQDLFMVDMVDLDPRPVAPPNGIISDRDPLPIIIYSVLTGMCAPIWEENIFRGFLLPSLSKFLSMPMSVLVSAVFFAAAHYSLEGFLPLVVLGTLLGIVFIWSKNLAAPILLHSLYNMYIIYQQIVMYMGA